MAKLDVRISVDTSRLEEQLREMGDAIGGAVVSMRALGATLTHTDTEVRTDDGSGTRYDDWYTLEIKPWVCGGCKTVLSHVSVSPNQRGHYIIVWPERDDPEMFKSAIRQEHERGEKPRVVVYEHSMGPCLSYYEYERRREGDGFDGLD